VVWPSCTVGVGVGAVKWRKATRSQIGRAEKRQQAQPCRAQRGGQPSLGVEGVTKSGNYERRTGAVSGPVHLALAKAGVDEVERVGKEEWWRRVELETTKGNRLRVEHSDQRVEHETVVPRPLRGAGCRRGLGAGAHRVGGRGGKESQGAREPLTTQSARYAWCGRA
jgi:hypothetical protein